MVETEVKDGTNVEITAGRVREQLDMLIRDHAFRSSKRSVAFLRYVVEQTLNGSADQIKERTIGVEVFDREPSYDTNLDHIVRTAATELRKRLAIYYGEEKHRSELRIGLIPGSYIPRFTVPVGALATVTDPKLNQELGVVQTQAATFEIGPELFSNERNGLGGLARKKLSFWPILALSITFLAVGTIGYSWVHRESEQDRFWKPVLET